MSRPRPAFHPVHSLPLVFVYKNLHLSKPGRAVWSIRQHPRGKILGHAAALMLFNPRFVVAESGRQRVLREGRKNVHAGVVGRLALVTTVWPPSTEWFRVGYNPYRGPHFTLRRTPPKSRSWQGWPLLRAELARFSPAGLVYVTVPVCFKDLTCQQQSTKIRGKKLSSSRTRQMSKP